MSASTLPTLNPRPRRQAADLAGFREVRAASEALAEPLSPEDCVAQSMPDASPVKWHLAHTTWFFETFVLEALDPGYQHVDPDYRVLFNSYYQSVGAQHPRPERGMLTRPSLDAVLDYRAAVDAAIAAHYRTGRIRGEAARVVEVGLHHEQQHQELILTDLKHLLACNPTYPAYRPDLPVGAGGASPLRYETFPTGIRSIGHAGEGFAFDNEGPRHEVLVPGFSLASRPVTNREYLRFIEAGGYREPEYWLSEGWETVQREGWSSPGYWVAAAERAATPTDGSEDWHLFTLGGLRPLADALDDPVCHVSYYEADAFARFAGARLPTEEEWEVAAQGEHATGNFVEHGALHPVAGGARGTRFDKLYGDVWEWTRSPYVGYPGFRISDGALGEYNGKFMVNQLVLRGGSCATPVAHIRATYRNFFPASARWQFSGIRLAQDAA